MSFIRFMQLSKFLLHISYFQHGQPWTDHDLPYTALSHPVTSLLVTACHYLLMSSMVSPIGGKVRLVVFQ